MKYKLDLNKKFEWSEDKDRFLRRERHISFKEIFALVKRNCVLDVIDHPNRERFPHQKIIIVNKDGYAYSVPFVEDEYKYFLKTVYANRKATKKYIKK